MLLCPSDSCSALGLRFPRPAVARGTGRLPRASLRRGTPRRCPQAESVPERRRVRRAFLWLGPFGAARQRRLAELACSRPSVPRAGGGGQTEPRVTTSGPAVPRRIGLVG